MTPLPGSSSWNVDLLLEAVEQLSPTEQREFQRRLARGQAANDSTESGRSEIDPSRPGSFTGRGRTPLAETRCPQ